MLNLVGIYIIWLWDVNILIELFEWVEVLNWSKILINIGLLLNHEFVLIIYQAHGDIEIEIIDKNTIFR